MLRRLLVPTAILTVVYVSKIDSIQFLTLGSNISWTNIGSNFSFFHLLFFMPVMGEFACIPQTQKKTIDQGMYLTGVGLLITFNVITMKEKVKNIVTFSLQAI